ncbi:pyruvate dehydrogenase (acetyl-transferring) E1 component subunit alpha, partial [Candidatus Woesearchaeota archaeon]|nr:pyruvate dehydrogenase (acetyl-transferring) E1 component subunit alpha [Candidatus Woesearchaeota archaeon]
KGIPTLIEAVTFRQGPHTTADDPKKYRTDEDVQKWLSKDPIKRVKRYLEKKKLWDEKKEAALLKDCEEKIEAAVKHMESTTYNKDDIFLHHYAELSQELKEQYEEFKKWQN